MDADYMHRPREQFISRRNSCWSMNSHRLEAIVAELMKPISDARRNFDTDLSALLEEYLTEAGLHALDAGEDAGEEDVVAPNFSELALLLQQSASIYSKKVDFLYQHVLEVSDSMLNSTQEANLSTAAEALPVASARRKRKASAVAGAGEFAALRLAAAAGARRAAQAARPPPTLPRRFAELAPAAAAAAARDLPLHDYLGEPIGLLADFHLTWRLHEGLLVDDLQGTSRSSESTLRPISLIELQAAIEAAATPPPASPPPPLAASPPRSPAEPLRASTPLPAPEPPPLVALVTPNVLDTPKSARKERKRRSDVTIDDVILGTAKLVITKELLDQLAEVREFSIPSSWIARVVTKRKRHILSERRRLRAEEEALSAEFAGWSSSEAAEAVAAAAARSKTCALELESDDDGFFEQSSLGEADASRADEAGARQAEQAERAAWQARVLARAGAAGRPDVRELGARVLATLRPPARAPAPFPRVLAAAAAHQPDVSRLLLATLFLANAGNVEIIQGPPLSVNSFSVRVLSTDERLYSAVAADEQVLR